MEVIAVVVIVNPRVELFLCRITNVHMLSAVYFILKRLRYRRNDECKYLNKHYGDTEPYYKYKWRRCSIILDLNTTDNYNKG